MNEPAELSPSAITATPAPARPRIARLPARLVNQIAAGEVVVRPAAALKELIENSLDAGATAIEVAVEEDALGFTITDDGCGMDVENLRLAVERHATSKIRELDDLIDLRTRGFRGEALAAIGAVSRLEILTRAAAGVIGHRLRIDGGADLRIEDAAANVGTTIVVRDLFYNTPVRLKFLKAAVAEWGRMAQTIVRQALTRPDVAFRVRWRGRPYLTLPAGQTLAQRLAEVLPGEKLGELLELDCALFEARAWGAVTGPNATRRDRRHQYFFVNGRPISFRPLAFALEEAYKGLLMTQRYPLGAVMIELPGELVDVNVHPTKEEVRFRNEPLVTGVVHRAVREALTAAELIPSLQLPTPGARFAPGGNARFPVPETKAANALSPAASTDASPRPELRMDGGRLASPAAPDESAEAARQLEFVPGFGLSNADAQVEALTRRIERGESRPYPPGDGDATPEQRESRLIERLRALPHRPRAVAQVGLTYIVADAGEAGLVVIDQHAAHEKILYLNFMRESERRAGRPEVQPLMIPHTLEFSAEDAVTLEGLLPALAAAGFEVEPFGERAFLVQALPVVFERLNVEAFIRDLLDDVGQGDLPRELERLRHRIFARAACRAAVMAGDALELPEMQRLVDELCETGEALRCPHGRPTALALTREQLDRQFGRMG